jgi:membrane-associated phospholipid phosphatase
MAAFDLQQSLWAAHVSPEVKLGAGVSAFPSMHVASATLFALTAWSTDRRFGWLMIAFLAYVQFASVFLGWHYAVDGYASMIGTAVIWLVVGWALKRPAERAAFEPAATSA